LSDAIRATWKKLEQAAGNCDATRTNSKSAPQPKKADHGRRHTSRRKRATDDLGGVQVEEHPEDDLECIALYVPCETASVVCIAGAASGCVASFFGYPICLAAALLGCAYAFGVCRRGVRLGGTCCPVRCGGNLDALNPFGQDPGCCEEGETCLHPNSVTSPCCPPGRINCGGECCLSGSCANGNCCHSPNVLCGTTCVAPFTTCCGGNPCNGICIGATCCEGGFNCGGFCCQSGRTCCGNTCCPTPGQVCCNGVCCPSGYECQNNQCVQVCNPGEVPCAGQCCTGGRTCRTCPNGARICSFSPCVN
jgi:hypothetical protein